MRRRRPSPKAGPSRSPRRSRSPSSARTGLVRPKIARVETRELGRSGVSVTRIVLGCGNFGGVGSSPAFFGQGIPHEEASRIMDAAWELGIRTFDTADAYGGGSSETWIGEWLATKGSDVRDAITVETKTFNPMTEGADRGLSPRSGSGAKSSRAWSGSGSSGSLSTWHTTSTRTRRRRRPLRRSTSSSARARSARSAPRTSRRAARRGRRDLRARGPDALRVGAELVLAPRRRRRGDRVSRLPRARARIRGVRAARRGWLDREVPARCRLPGGLPHDAAAGRVPRLRERRVFDALEALEARGDRTRGVDGGLALAWLLGVPEITGVVVGPTRAEHLQPVSEALSLELSTEEHAHLRGLFP